MGELRRVVETVGCRDTDAIPKVADAGRVVVENGRSVQIMHNGLRILEGSYYGDWATHIMRGLQGHHEPQEELLFHHVLRYCRNGTLIVELGAYWSYYTAWYLREVPRSHAICIEPDEEHTRIGQQNLALNGLADRAVYHRAFAGEHSEKYWNWSETLGEKIALPAYDMNDVLGLSGGEPVELLHMDIQGGELPFIRSLERAVQERLVRFAVVSTHRADISGSDTTHQDCLARIRKMGGTVLAEHSIAESFSSDGLIVASFFDEDRGIVLPSISRRRIAPPPSEPAAPRPVPLLPRLARGVLRRARRYLAH